MDGDSQYFLPTHADTQNRRQHCSPSYCDQTLYHFDPGYNSFSLHRPPSAAARQTKCWPSALAWWWVGINLFAGEDGPAWEGPFAAALLSSGSQKCGFSSKCKNTQSFSPVHLHQETLHFTLQFVIQSLSLNNIIIGTNNWIPSLAVLSEIHL